MTTSVVHACIDIRGMLRWDRRRLGKAILREDDTYATADEAREWLLDQIAAGRKVLPKGDPCDGFSYETGCPGHEETER